LGNYSREDFFSDLVAGITVGVVALPLAMAFGIASGVDPKAGIYTAIIAGFLISALGGSKVQVGGPTGAFVAIVYGIIAQYGVDRLILCTLMAGVMLLIMAFAGLGALIKFIPFPVTAGFTGGIAVLILSTQIKDFFGLDVKNVPADFVHKLVILARHFQPNWISVLLAGSSVAMILLWPKKLTGRLPGSIVALILGTVAVVVFQLDTHFAVETIGTRFGGIPQGLPPLRIPEITFVQVQELFRPAFTIALLAAIESLLCAVVADGMIDDRHDSNQELFGQGMANIGSALFGGIPATGAIARTATNIRSGARTPVAGTVHAFTLLVIVLVAAPLARHVPLATLSGVLIVVAVRMAEWGHFKRLLHWPRGDAAMFLAAFGLTVLIDLTVAVEVGMVLAAVLFIKRTSEATQITGMDQESATDAPQHSLVGKEIPEGVVAFRIFGAFLFGATDKLETALKRTRQKPRVLILRMHSVLAIDATGLNALEEIHGKLHRRGAHLVISGLHAQPLFAMERGGFIDRIGLPNLCGDLDHALQRARDLLAQTSSAHA
jgi:SulP family sulfate permease